MLHVISRDGTKIAYEKTGAGPALLIIGGALVDHHNYVPLAISLADKFEVYNFDRRGQSADTAPYTVEREVEDVLPIINSIGRPVIVYGHSSGSALAIHVAAVGDKIVKLVIADPPFTPHSNDDIKAREEFSEAMAVIQALHDKGDHKGSATFFLSGFVLSAEEVDGILSSPAGEGMIDCDHAFFECKVGLLQRVFIPGRMVAIPLSAWKSNVLSDKSGREDDMGALKSKIDGFHYGEQGKYIMRFMAGISGRGNCGEESSDCRCRSRRSYSRNAACP